MADYRIEAPITLIAPLLIRVTAPITLIAPLLIRVTAPITLIYKLPTVPCTIDDDCPIGYVCEDGVCVPENGNGPNGEETGWDRFLKWIEENWAVAAGGTFLVSAAILLLPGGKKK